MRLKSFFDIRHVALATHKASDLRRKMLSGKFVGRIGRKLVPPHVRPMRAI
jgi:hypothetical protein